MTQFRIWNYGDTFTSKNATTAMMALHGVGVYRGYRLEVDGPQSVRLTPGWALLPNGILVGEDDNKRLSLTVAPAAATTYTITVRHTDSDVMGGSAAVYALEEGDIRQEAVSDGVVLGYIKHPGSGLPLEDTFLFSSHLLSEDNRDLSPVEMKAPFQGKWFVSSVGTNTTSSTAIVGTTKVSDVFSTGALGPVPPLYESTEIHVPLSAGKFRPVCFEIDAQVDPNSSIVLTLLDTMGDVVTLGSPTVAPTVDMKVHTSTVPVDTGVFTPGSPYILRVEVRTPQLDSVAIHSIKVIHDFISKP